MNEYQNIASIIVEEQHENSVIKHQENVPDDIKEEMESIDEFMRQEF